jgi:hypothetical protein
MRLSSKNAFCVLMLLFIFGCRGCPPKPPIGDDEIVDPPKKVTVEKINFFLENSRSMAGYIYFNTDFSSDVDNILVNLDKHFSSKVFPYTVGEEVGDYQGDIVKFRDDLNPTNNTRISIENSSLLHNILKKVMDSTGVNDISILVTDGIMSGSNEDLNRYDDSGQDKYFNIDNIDSGLRGDITLALKSKGNKVIKILAYHSNFHSGRRVGSDWYYYYKADNNRYSGRLEGVLPNRPYYLFIIGNEEQVRAFEEKTKGVFNPIKTIEIGFKYDQVDFKLTNSSQSKKSTRAKTIVNNGNISHELQFQKNSGLYRFSVLLNLAKADKMFNSKDYLRKYLSVKITNKIYGNPEVVDLLTDNSNDLWFPNTNKNEYKDFTHVVTFEVTDYSPSKGDDVYFRLINDVEYWSGTSEWSNSNDLNMDLDDASTFGFKFLIQGIKNAYYNNEEVFIFNDRINTIKPYK